METTQEGSSAKPIIDFDVIDEKLVQKMVYDALVWSSLFGYSSLLDFLGLMLVLI